MLDHVLYAVREVGQRACLSSGALSPRRQGWSGKGETSETTTNVEVTDGSWFLDIYLYDYTNVQTSDYPEKAVLQDTATPLVSEPVQKQTPELISLHQAMSIKTDS